MRFPSIFPESAWSGLHYGNPLKRYRLSRKAVYNAACAGSSLASASASTVTSPPRWIGRFSLHAQGLFDVVRLCTIDTAVMGRKTYDVALKMGGGSYNGYGLKSYVFSIFSRAASAPA